MRITGEMMTGDKLLAALRAHLGQWVAVRGDEVIASGEAPEDVLHSIWEQGLRADSVPGATRSLCGGVTRPPRGMIRMERMRKGTRT